MTSLINWLLAIGCLSIGSALAFWGFTEVNKMIAIWVLGVPGGIMLVLAGGVELTKFAINSDKPKIKAVNTSKVDDSNRPWISLQPEIGSDLTYDEQGNARIVINFILQNVGKFPAANVQIDAEIIPVFGDARPFQKAIAERNRLRPAGLGNLGVTVFPGPPQVHSQNLRIPRAAIEAFHKKIISDFGVEAKAEAKMGVTYLPSLVGVVDYEFTFAEGHHQTGFILDLRKKDPRNPNAALHFDVQEGTIPKSRLWLIQGLMSVAPD
jgi:hypothetical protein